MCGSDAVPQKRASISDRKFSLSNSLALRMPANGGLAPATSRSSPRVTFW